MEEDQVIKVDNGAIIPPKRGIEVDEPIEQDTGEVISVDEIEKAPVVKIDEAKVPEPTFIADELPTETVEEPQKAPQAPVRQERKDNELLTEIENNRAILEELGLSEITRLSRDFAEKGTRTVELEEREGVNEAVRERNRITNEINEKTLAFRRERERIQTDETLSSARKSVKLAEVARVQNRELADLAVLKATANNNLTTAQAIVDRKVELEFQPIQAELDLQKQLFEINSGLFSKAEQRQFDEKMQERQVEIDKDKFKFQQLENMKLQAIANGSEAGKGAEFSKLIQRAETQEDFFNIPGINKFLTSKEQKLKMQLLQLQLEEKGYENEKLREARASAESGDYKLTGKEDFVVAGFAKRMQDSMDIINGLIQEGVDVRPQAVANNKLAGRTGKERQMIVAYRDFIAAKLRKESGAAIPPEEYLSESFNIVVRNRDNEKTISQKKDIMESSTMSLIGASKGGYNYLVQQADSNNKVISAVKEARASGYKNSEIVTQLISMYPDNEGNIRQAIAEGYSLEDIAEFLQ